MTTRTLWRRLERLEAARARRTERLEAEREAIARPKRIRRDMAAGETQIATFRIVHGRLEYVGEVVMRPFEQP